MRILAIALISTVSLSAPAVAQDRQTLGFGRLFNNDFFGDGRDRWRSGSYSFSLIRGSDDWQGRAPSQMFDVIEYRLQSEIITPRNLSGAATDRPYVTSTTIGAHTHFARGDFDIGLGAHVTFSGPQTGLADFQDALHEILGASDVQVADDELPNATYFGGVAEVARPMQVSSAVTVRPFVEVVAGAEDTARVGADLFYGSIGHSDLLLRDSSTGQLYRGVEGDQGGYALVLGADFAHVSDSEWLPAEDTRDGRARLRGGVHWQFAPDTSFFYGLTYLSEEFEGRGEGQFIGSLKLNFNF